MPERFYGLRRNASLPPPCSLLRSAELALAAVARKQKAARTATEEEESNRRQGRGNISATEGGVIGGIL